ncbi:MAG: HPr family phosphocarrier protein [Gammaproteobacteria bacterium]|nr:HPr family phosphocarrier protein [Gammaproteobacteria bacterium]
MLETKVIIINKLGLHARAAAKFVTLASKFASDISLKKNNQEVNGKSIMGVMMLAASKGTELVLIATGDDEIQSSEELHQLIQSRFGEDE